jgi:short subunit fatty acids transporter
MKEFWLWVTIVTLILLCLIILSFAILHTNKQIKKVDLMIMRMEEKEKKRNQKLEPLTE